VALAEVLVGIGSYDGSSEKSKGGSFKEPSNSNYFTLNMLNMHLGCVGGGNVVAGNAMANGHTAP
jgi:hypothetical protein